MLIALKNFPFSRDGISTEHAKAGELVVLPEDLIPGLLAVGFVGYPPAEEDKTPPAPQTWQKPPAPGTQAAAPANKMDTVPETDNKTPSAKPAAKTTKKKAE